MPYDGSGMRGAFGFDGLGERSPRKLIPFFDHVRENVVAFRDGRLMAMFRIPGRSWYLASNSTRNAGWRIAAGVLQLIADSGTEISQHLCVDRDRTVPMPGPGGTEFAEHFWGEYASRCLSGAKTLDWYVCVSVKGNPVKGLRAKRAARKRGEVWVDAVALRNLENKCAAVLSALRWHGAERLGQYDNEKGTVCSAIGRALVYVRTLRWVEVPMTQPAGSFALNVYPDRVVHGAHGFKVLRDGGETGASYGRMYSLKGYPLKPRVGMLDDLVAPKPGTPMTAARFVITNHARPIERAAASAHLELIFNRIVSADTKAVTQLQAIEEALDELATGREVRARHAWTLMVVADSVPQLDEHASEVVTQLKAVGCTPHPAGLASEALHWGQWHGNREWCNRPARIGLQRLAFLAPLDGFPVFAAEPKWRHPLMWFLTPGQTMYPFDLHSNNNGNTLFIAPTRSGKTLLMGALITMATFLLGETGLIFLIDKDRSNALAILNNGGSYTMIRRGQDSGLAPMKRLPDTAGGREVVVDLLKAMIVSENPEPITPMELEQLSEGVAHTMALPDRFRTIGAVHSYLPPGSAADRLKPWCRGERRGWAFDGERDTVDVENRVCGVDLTELLDDADVLPIAAQYLMHIVKEKMDGHRNGIFVCEEAKFFLSKPMFRQAFEDFSYTGGKKNFPIWMVTQQPEHILELPNGSALIGQFRTIWLLGNEKAQRRWYCDGLQCTDREFDLIRGGMLSPRSVLLQRPGESELLRFDLSAMLDSIVPILSSTPDSVDLWDDVVREVGSRDPAEVRPVFLKRLKERKIRNAKRETAEASA